MNAFMKTLLGINWKTTLAGLLTFLTSVPGFVGALQAWVAHQPVDWRQVMFSVALAVAGVGLHSAKDSSTHSTVEQVEQSSKTDAK